MIKSNKANFNNTCNYNVFIKKFIILCFIAYIITIYIFNNFEQKSNIKEFDKIKYDIVIPVSIIDINKTLQLKNIFKKFIKFDNMILISDTNSNFLYKKDSIKIINEDLLLPKINLIKIFINLGINDTSRVGWYEQQFLKMEYSKICNNDYYLLWDSDTIPIKPVKMFDNDKPIFDLKKEHHSPYFVTLNRLIPNLHFIKYSYISEHMLIKTEFMKRLIDSIENNYNLNGKKYWEKIILSIDKNEIIRSGFSEFETYGTFVDNYYPHAYTHRIWYSKRDMAKYYGDANNLSENDLNWLSKDYNAVTFEKWDLFNKDYIQFVTELRYQNLCRPRRFFKYFKRIIHKYKIYILDKKNII